MDLFPALHATWPAEAEHRAGGFILRRGAGGGGRVSAASLAALTDELSDGSPVDVAAAEATMRGWGQAPLFMIREDRAADLSLDTTLAAAGYTLRDPTVIMAADAAAIRPTAPDTAVIHGDAPLAKMTELWAAGGIGPARLAVMARTAPPRCYLLARLGDRPEGCAFVAGHSGVAFVSAVEVAPTARRRGVGLSLTRGAAAWAADGGLPTLALAVTRANEAARSLYRTAGLSEVTGYRYRVLP